MKKAMLGYQLLSVYKEASADLYSVLRQVRDMGYDGVEFIGLFGHEAAEVREMLDALGLVGISNLVPYKYLTGDIYKTISDCLTVGCKYISVLLMDAEALPGGKNFAATLRQLYRIGGIARAAGIQLIYHNHGYEFCDISGQRALDFIMDAVPPERLQPELDCYWVKYAGIDPAAYIRKYAGRCDLIHLKDYVGYKEGAVAPENCADAPAFEFRPVGHGWQDTPATVAAALESGAKWLIVEQDASVGRTQLEAARLSIESLHGLGL